MSPPPLAVREQIREEQLRSVWTQELDAVFADVAPYYDRANNVASLGLWKWFLNIFMSTIEVRPGAADAGCLRGDQCGRNCTSREGANP